MHPVRRQRGGAGALVRWVGIGVRITRTTGFVSGSNGNVVTDVKANSVFVYSIGSKWGCNAHRNDLGQQHGFEDAVKGA